MLTTGKPTRILVVDDDEEDFIITRQYISRIPHHFFEIEWCRSFAEALQRIRNREHDIYFVDYYLGPQTGLDLLVDAGRLQCEEPIILLTGNGNHHVDVAAMEAGAFDYLVKSELSTEKLERSIRFALDKAANLRQLRMNELKFRHFFEHSKDAVFIADESGHFTEFNEATIHFFDRPRTAMESMSIYDLLDDSDNRILRSHLEFKQHINDLTLQIQTPAGEKKFCMLSMTREQNLKGNVYLQGILHDLSNIKKAERAYLMLEKLEATGRLARILAHEIRNPLSNINLAADQLTLPGLDAAMAKNFLNIIHRNSNAINNILTELLNSSRPGETMLEETTVQSVVGRSIEQCMDRILLKKIKFDIVLPEEPLPFIADTEKMIIAICNIILNAIEAMEPEKGHLQIRLEMEDDHYVLIIEDNGCGIEEEHLLRLYEPYYTSKLNGMGLGLPSALNILKMHRGYIDVETKLGMGTRFFVRLEKSDRIGHSEPDQVVKN